MTKTDTSQLIKILTHLNIDIISMQHLAVNIRDKTLFLDNKIPLNISQPFTMTPIELAQELGYDEFISNQNNKHKINENTILFDCTIHKYANFIQGYKKRRVKVVLNFLISYSKKVTVIDLNNCKCIRKNNKIIVKYLGRRYFFKGDPNAVDRLYAIVADRNLRLAMSVCQEKDTYNIYMFSYLAECIAKSMKIEGLIENMSNLHSLVFNKNCKYGLKNKSTSFYKIYRNSLNMVTSSNYEPLSFLQRLAEPFMNIDCLVLNETELVLFRSIIIFLISAYSIYEKRVKMYFEPLLHETFLLKQTNFMIYVEKSTKDVINLIYKDKNIVFMQCGNLCEFKINDYIIQYNYDQTKLVKPSNEFYNILNLTTKIKFYKLRIPTDNLMGSMEDPNNCFLFPHITNEDELESYIQIYTSTLVFNNHKLNGNISDNSETIEIIKGKWNENIEFVDVDSQIVKHNWNFDFKVFNEYYNFSIYTMQLNYITQDVLNKSDSRLREDIRLLENGNVTECREAYEILMNRDKIKNFDENIVDGRLFKIVDGDWVFRNDNLVSVDDVEFKI